MSFTLIIGLVVALWVYRDAQSYGHSKNSALLWALGTIPFFIVVFPLYLLLGRKSQIKQNKKIEQQIIDAEVIVEDEDAIDCPMCAKKVKEEFKNCPYCGYSLKLKCANCGEELKRGWQYCPSCQAKTPEK